MPSLVHLRAKPETLTAPFKCLASSSVQATSFSTFCLSFFPPSAELTQRAHNKVLCMLSLCKFLVHKLYSYADKVAGSKMARNLSPGSDFLEKHP